MKKDSVLVVGLVILLLGMPFLALSVHQARIEPTISTLQVQSPFLYTNGTKLYLNGSEFHMIGANHADLSSSFMNPTSINENGTQVIADASSYHIKALRFSITGLSPDIVEKWYMNRTDFFSHFDKLIEVASNNHVYLIPVLTWTTWGNESGMFEPFHNFSRKFGILPQNEVSGKSRIFIPGSTVNLLFKQFVNDTVTRYKDNRTILMWEIGNELNLVLGRAEDYFPTLEDLHAFLNDTCSFIRELDPNHLIESGMAAPVPKEQGDSLADVLYNFTLFNSFVDVASMHVYPDQPKNYSVATEEYVNAFLNVSQTVLNKPLIIGEFGDNLIASQSWFNVQVFETALQSKIPLSLIWEWMVPSDRDENRTMFSVNPGSLMANLTRDYSILIGTQLTLYNNVVACLGSAYSMSTLSNSTVTSFQNNVSQGRIEFNVTGNAGTFGVCRVSIPNEMKEKLENKTVWSGTYVVKIDGKIVPHDDWTNGSEDGYRFIFFSNQQSTHEVVIVPESLSLLALLLLMTFTPFVIIVYRRRCSKHMTQSPCISRM